LKKPIDSSKERHFVNKKKGGENPMLRYFILIKKNSKAMKASIKTENKTQFFFTHRTVMFIKGEILINSPAKHQKTYENEITKFSIDDF
jgi:hypothetical protein